MLSKWHFYEFRPVKDTDLFANVADIDFIQPLLIRARGIAKVSCVCHTRHPFVGKYRELLSLTHQAVNSTLLLTSKEYGF